VVNIVEYSKIELFKVIAFNLDSGVNPFVICIEFKANITSIYIPSDPNKCFNASSFDHYHVLPIDCKRFLLFSPTVFAQTFIILYDSLKKLARSLRVTNNVAAFRGDLVESKVYFNC